MAVAAAEGESRRPSSGWRLAKVPSAYLRSHAEDPVDWHPWGIEAFSLARDRGRPVLLSVGYAACHWCGVMHRESFQDQDVAVVLNRDFVCVKVDREQRPDVDATYLEACQQLIGRAGWPLNVFLTPARAPFHATTYVPREGDATRTGWLEVLATVDRAWRTQRHEVALRADLTLADLRRRPPRSPVAAIEVLECATRALGACHDREGQGLAPLPHAEGARYPAPVAAELLFESGQETIAAQALLAVVRGGVHDHVGGGFFRYTGDRAGRAPHFEKLLSHNAAIARACLHVGLATDEPELLSAASAALDWMLRELATPNGGLRGSLAADAGGVEGGFYRWTAEQIAADGRGDDAPALLGIARETPAPGRVPVPVPAVHGTERVRQVLASLRRERDRDRPRPARDESLVTAANAAAVTALAEGAAILERPELLCHARRLGGWIEAALRQPDGSLAHGATEDGPTGAGLLDDYATVLECLVTLQQEDPDAQRRAWIEELGATLCARFWDKRLRQLTLTEASAPAPLFALTAAHDTTAPGAAGTAAIALLRAGALMGDHRWDDVAQATANAAAAAAGEHPVAYAQALRALRLVHLGVRRLELAAGIAPDLRHVVDARHRLHVVVHPAAALGPGTALVCTQDGCSLPTRDPRSLAELLDRPPPG